VTESPTSCAAARYRQTLEEMAGLVGDQGHTDETRRWERLVEQLDAERVALEDSADGKSSIRALMGDHRPTVRLWSAAAALFWDPEQARPVLEEIREEPLRYGLHSITAKHTLLDFDAGVLSPGGDLPGSPASGSS
jgi:hypothetical protein